MGQDRDFMALALAEARAALEHRDVPVGCVVARGDESLAKTHNTRERDGDPTAHAEILALREAAARTGSWRLEGCAVYVTLEPCPMCAMAMVWARVDRLVFGAMDPKAGAAGSLYDIPEDQRLNHRIEVTGGVREDECAALLKEFFGAKR